MPTDVLLERFRFESGLVAGSKASAVTNPGAGLPFSFAGICPHTHARRESLWDIVRARQVDQIQEQGESFLCAMDQAIAAVEELLDMTSEPLQGILAELEQLRQEHKDHWLWLRKEDVDEALAESARGETLELDDAFAQMAGVSREEWLRRVEEHQRLYHSKDAQE